MGYHVEAQYRPEHGDAPQILASHEDVDALVDHPLGEDFYHTVAALYAVERPHLPSGVPDHEMCLAVDPILKVGALTFMDETGNWASADHPTGESRLTMR